MPTTHAATVYDPTFLSGYALSLVLSCKTGKGLDKSSSALQGSRSQDFSKVPAWRREH